MSQNNNITMYNYTNLNNQFDAVEWIIDTTPDYDLTNNVNNSHHIYEVSNQNNQFSQLIEAVVINNNIQFITEDDYIPFESQISQPISIEIDVRKIPVSEEERNCCICYETKESEDISQINCGHKFCGTCIIDHVSINYLNLCCPLCREKINHITFQRYCYEYDFEDL